jgi:hypothetical protein
MMSISTHLATDVAIPAPLTPTPGIGPMPRISRKFKHEFIERAMAVAITGNRTFSTDLRVSIKTMDRPKGIKPGERWRRYTAPASITRVSSEYIEISFSGISDAPRVKTRPTKKLKVRQSPMFIRMPGISLLPQNCALKIVPPEQMPNMVRLYRKKIWFPRPTAAISTVPRRPIKTVLSIPTKELMKFWSTIGREIVKRLL